MPKETSFPKTTRPNAKEQREQPAKTSAGEKMHRKMDAFPDKIDVRDWFYQPRLTALPDAVINCDKVPLILDQGKEGACTGFAMAACINFHLVDNGRVPSKDIVKGCVSPRMLYEMARRYDEWPGENYEGSSARGTMKGWVAHGVVNRSSWGDDLFGPSNLDETRAKEGLKTPAGAYYRVMHKQVRDMHSALYETGILYATLMVHAGWNDPKEEVRNYNYIRDSKQKRLKLPLIQRKGRADGGHAIAIVGYTLDGFIIQNSWGPSWGNKGFAVLPYEDWLLHASDCWVAQIGVPIDVNLWETGMADTAAGKQRASQTIPLEAIRPYVVNVGNNGFLSDSGSYWTTKGDIERLFQTIGTTSKTWKKKRIMLYLHGGLNSEKDVAKRIISFKEVLLKNEIYPVHIMWETDFWQSMKSSLFDVFTDDDKASANWLSRLRESTFEILDRTFELTASRPGTLLWDEMKENAKLSSVQGRSMDVLADCALAAYNQLSAEEKQDFEIHIVGHSAGSIFTAFAIDTLLKIGVPIKSIQFMAPAISISLFKEKLLPRIKTKECPLPTIYMLSDVGERDDNVWKYGKSLLYLVSNSFERKRDTPILGMERFMNNKNTELDKDFIDEELANLYNGKVDGFPALVIAGVAPAKIKSSEEPSPSVSRSDTHGGFDNDHYTLNSVLFRVLKGAPKPAFEVRDLQY